MRVNHLICRNLAQIGPACDQLPNACGEFGTTITNPIPVSGHLVRRSISITCGQNRVLGSSVIGLEVTPPPYRAPQLM